MRTEQEIIEKKQEWEEEHKRKKEDVQVPSKEVKILEQRMWTLNWVTEFNHTETDGALRTGNVAEKAIAREAYFEGYDLGYGVEELDDIDERMIAEKFEQWWKKNGV